jgi:hypothetical protein
MAQFIEKQKTICIIYLLSHYWLYIIIIIYIMYLLQIVNIQYSNEII